MKNNWQTKKLEEIADFQKGKLMQNSTIKTEGTTPYILIDDLRTNKFTHYTPSNNGTACVSKDSLLAWDGANAGTVGGGLEGFVGSTITKISPKEEVEPIYLRMFLSSKFKEFNSHTHGAAVPHLDRDFVLGYSVPLPPIDKQKEIVKKLDSIKNLQELNQKEIEKAEELFNGLVNKTFAPRVGKKCKINEVTEGFQYGLSRAMNTSGGGTPILRINSIQNGNITDEDLKHLKVNTEELKKYKVDFNDILFNRTNSYELVGKTGIFKLTGTFVFASYLIRLKAKEKILPDYLNYFLNSSIGQAEIKKRAKRAVSQANVNAKELGSITMYIPEKSIQEMAIKQLDSNKQYLNTLKCEKEKTTELFDSFLHKLLQGEQK